ncbi:TPA: small membrane protein YohP, partial [Salmonella enterica subsp. enterica serovar Birkenhead]
DFAAIRASSLHELNVAAPNKAADGLILSYTLFVFTNKGQTMKILLWAILIIFLIGLLVVTGVFKMIF